MKKHNPYNLQEVMHKWSLSEEEATCKINILKSKTSGTLENFIKRHGPIDGPIKFATFQFKSKHTQQKYIDQYGEIEGNIIWQKYIAKKDCNSLNYFLDKYGPELGPVKFDEKCNKSKVTFEVFERKFGIDAKQKYQEYIYNKTRHCFLFATASKQSLQFFQPLIFELDILKIEYNLGVDGNNELKLWDNDLKRNFYYDLSIPSYKLIFEFDGHSHPHKSHNQLTWKCPYSGSSYEKAINYDLHKTKLAQNYGYELYRFHYLDIKSDKEFYKQQLIKIFQDKYENKKNI